MNALDYRRQLELLLPTGPAIEPITGSRLAQFLDGIARELARVEGRGVDLLNEADPTTSGELFESWLSMVGIPDGCSVYAIGAGDERAQLIQRLVKQSGQTPAFYQELAEKLGYTANVVEFEPLAVGSSAGAAMYDNNWAFAFSVVLSGVALRAQAGIARAGARTTDFSEEFFSCVLSTAKPGHTVAFVGFE